MSWTFFKRQHCNGKPASSWTLIAWHHPNSITWRFGVWYTTKKSGDAGLYFIRVYRGQGFNFQAGLNLPLIGAVSIHTQPHMWRKV